MSEPSTGTAGSKSGTTHVRSTRVGRYLPPLGSEFISVEAASGMALLVGAAVALVWVNVDAVSYTDLFAVDLGPFTFSTWINDGLMAVFFFVVGLEIKREVVEGELRDRRHAALPVIAALGGMIVPALIFAAWTFGGEAASGWGIPMATDIAFAIGVLAILGSRVRPQAKLFLLALAIVDDIGAILVIAIFYSTDVSVVWLLAAVGVSIGVALLRRVGFAHPAWYLLPGIALWLCVHESGIHATIAGVALAFLLPTGPGNDDGPLETLERKLHPLTSFVILPLFALANAGVVLGGDSIARAFESPITLGIVTGLILGKMLGITAFAWAGLKLGIARLPTGLDCLQIFAVAIIAGIGFTVSLFVAGLTLTGVSLAHAKIGILAASLIAGGTGTLVVVVVSRRHASSRRPHESARASASPRH